MKNVTVPSNPSSICVLRLSAIGDACHALAAVQAIQRQWPNCEITWIIGKAEASLFSGLPGIEFIVFDKKQGKAGFKQLRQALSNRSFDVLLHMQYAMRASMVSRLVNAKCRVGFDKARAREFQWLFTNARIDPPSSPHVLDGFMAFAKKIGVEDLSVNWDFPIAEEDENWAREILGEETAGAVLICPASSKAYKNWTATGYAHVASYAHKHGFQVLIATGPAKEEVDLAIDIERELRCKVTNLAGKSSLKQLLALIREVDLVVSPDSGPAHMATMMDTPVVGLYAHHNPMRTGPYRSLDRVVSIWQNEIERETGKRADQLPWRARVKDKQAMGRIPSQDVIDQVAQVLETKETFVKSFSQ